MAPLKKCSKNSPYLLDYLKGLFAREWRRRVVWQCPARPSERTQFPKWHCSLTLLTKIMCLLSYSLARNLCPKYFTALYGIVHCIYVANTISISGCGPHINPHCTTIAIVGLCYKMISYSWLSNITPGRYFPSSTLLLWADLAVTVHCVVHVF